MQITRQMTRGRTTVTATKVEPIGSMFGITFDTGFQMVAPRAALSADLLAMAAAR